MNSSSPLDNSSSVTHPAIHADPSSSEANQKSKVGAHSVATPKTFSTCQKVAIVVLSIIAAAAIAATVIALLTATGNMAPLATVLFAGTNAYITAVVATAVACLSVGGAVAVGLYAKNTQAKTQLESTKQAAELSAFAQTNMSSYDIEGMRKDLAGKQIAIDTTQKQLITLHNENNDLLTQRNALASKNSELIKENHDVNQLSQISKTDLDKKNLEIANLNQKLLVSGINIMNLETQYSQLLAAHEATQTYITDRENQITASQKTDLALDNLSAQIIKNLDAELAAAKATIQSNEENMEKSIEQINELQVSNDQFKTLNATLQSLLNKEREELAALKRAAMDEQKYPS